jgi:hypothetical protein
MGKSRDRRLCTPEGAARRFMESLAQGRSSVRYDGDLSGQVERYKLARVEHDFQQTMVKQWLYSHGVPLCQLVTWLNFARHIHKVSRGYAAATCDLLARMAVDRWEKYGLARELLVRLCYDQYNIVPAGEEKGASAPTGAGGVEPPPATAAERVS